MAWQIGHPRLRRTGGRRRAALLRFAPVILRPLGAALGIAFVIWFATFDSHVTPSRAAIEKTPTAIVFTGSFERIDAALRLLEDGLVRQVHISGLNPGAGLFPDTLAAQFAARNPDIRDVPRLVACCVSWDARADTTLQNAAETKCWLGQPPHRDAVLLVTSRLHMARASLALRRELRRVRVLPYPVEDQGPEPSAQTRTMEFVKLLGTIVLKALPRIGPIAELYDPFADGCPGA